MSYIDADGYSDQPYAPDWDCEQHSCRNCDRTIVHVTSGSADCEELDDGPRLCDRYAETD